MKKSLFALLLLCIASVSCHESEQPTPFEGQFSKRSTMWIEGFVEQRDAILKQQNMSPRDFIAWSTEAAWNLPVAAQVALRSVRKAVPTPTNETLLQKVISLEDLPTYMNNTYGGTVGGFVSVAADMKQIATMYDTYWALRLDYTGTKFKPDGAGYAVIRFLSPAAATLTIPFCAELGGTQPHALPNTGGGFTGSKLADGGLPEYIFAGYSAPREGAEIYEVTPEGRELLRSKYTAARGWTTNEIGMPAPTTKATENQVRNGVYPSASKSGQVLVTTYALYQGNRYIVWGRSNDTYRLTTQTPYDNVPLEVEEKGIWAISVPVKGVEQIWEEEQPL